MGTRLSIDVYVAPMRPYTSPDQLGQGEVATWAPTSSTLISGPTEGILIDALLTFENADQIAAWAKSFGNKITGVYITHGHSDHWLGLARLLQHFPRGSRVRGPGGCGSRCLGGGVQQEEQVLDVALSVRAPRNARGARGAEH
jgi:glyoxylase-like metal-dependent hydrolase (beta-lactamase superfamily II)